MGVRLGRTVVLDGVLIAILVMSVGLIHREAVSSPWSDDRVLAEEPAWFQVAAPHLHAATLGAVSPAAGLTALFRPLTPWSRAGDIRSLAAGLAGLTAAVLFVLLRRWNVPRGIAALLACAPAAGTVIPVSTPVTITYTLHALLGAAAFLCLSFPAALPARAAALAGMTLLGTVNHASFLPFAAALWVALVWPARGSRRWIALAAVVSLAVSLCASAAVIRANARLSWVETAPLAGVSAAGLGSGDRPGVLELARGVATGRFPPRLQPLPQAAPWPGIIATQPFPVLLLAPLMLCAWARRESREAVVAAAGAAGAVVLFTWKTWLPDPSVAGALAGVSALLCAGAGLSWVAARRVRGAAALALAVAAFAGLNGFLDTSRSGERSESALLQAFAVSLQTRLVSGVWVAERLATDRVFLLDRRFSRRIAADASAVRALSPETPVIALPEARAALGRQGYGARPLVVAFPSMGAFMATRGEGDWVALAVRDDAGRASRMARELLELFGKTPVGALDRLVLLGRWNARGAPVGIVGRTQLDLRFGDELGVGRTRVPARFLVESEPEARVLINGVPVAEAPHGAVIVVYNPRTGDLVRQHFGAGDSEPALPFFDERWLRRAGS